MLGLSVGGVGGALVVVLGVAAVDDAVGGLAVGGVDAAFVVVLGLAVDGVADPLIGAFDFGGVVSSPDPTMLTSAQP